MAASTGLLEVWIEVIYEINSVFGMFMDQKFILFAYIYILL